MRETFTASPLRWPLALLFAIVLGAAVTHAPPLADLGAQLAEQPQLGDTFKDPQFGRQDAFVFVFSLLFLGPLALLVGFLLLLAVIAVLGGFVLPGVRALALPDWVATALVLVVLGALAYAKADVWLPRSLWILGLIARASRVVLT